ncbi:hypothetical protein HOF65_05605 [bacterium]|nr:hypothetical protein [bacterium]MBT3853417.1 hypothetical protein [bacterium]
MYQASNNSSLKLSANSKFFSFFALFLASNLFCNSSGISSSSSIIEKSTIHKT